MDLQLKGRTCLVTGASAGIGTGVARVMAAEGASVAITARRGDKLNALADEIAATGAQRPIVITADLSDGEAPKAIHDAVLDAFGHLDILVNNAGYAMPAPLGSPDKLWDDSHQINFTAVRRLTEAFLPSMLEREWGRIINVTGTMEPFAVNAATVAKAGVQAWAKGLSRDIGTGGVTVNCVIPGRIMSEQNERAMPDPADRQKFAEAHIPAGYFGEPEDIGYLMAFLASPLARLITGSILYVDGGMKRFSH